MVTKTSTFIINNYGEPSGYSVNRNYKNSLYSIKIQKKFLTNHSRSGSLCNCSISSKVKYCLFNKQLQKLKEYTIIMTFYYT